MGKHRKPKLIGKYAARTVPVIALCALMMIPTSAPSTHQTADLMVRTPRVVPTMPFGYYKPHPMAVAQHYVQREVVHKPREVTYTPKVHHAPVQSDSFNQKVLAAARAQIGVPYVWGGETPGVAFDCSGLTEYAYSRAGHWIPRVANDQFNFFRMIPKSQARPGDLVFFHDSSDPSSYVYHVGIYLSGDNMMIVAPDAGQDVQIQSFSWGGDTVTFGTLDIK